MSAETESLIAAAEERICAVEPHDAWSAPVRAVFAHARKQDEAIEQGRRDLVVFRSEIERLTRETWDLGTARDEARTALAAAEQDAARWQRIAAERDQRLVEANVGSERLAARVRELEAALDRIRAAAWPADGGKGASVNDIVEHLAHLHEAAGFGRPTQVEEETVPQLRAALAAAERAAAESAEQAIAEMRRAEAAEQALTEARRTVEAVHRVADADSAAHGAEVDALRAEVATVAAERDGLLRRLADADARALDAETQVAALTASLAEARRAGAAEALERLAVSLAASADPTADPPIAYSCASPANVRRFAAERDWRVALTDSAHPSVQGSKPAAIAAKETASLLARLAAAEKARSEAEAMVVGLAALARDVMRGRDLSKPAIWWEAAAHVAAMGLTSDHVVLEDVVERLRSRAQREERAQPVREPDILTDSAPLAARVLAEAEQRGEERAKETVLVGWNAEAAALRSQLTAAREERERLEAAAARLADSAEHMASRAPTSASAQESVLGAVGRLRGLLAEPSPAKDTCEKCDGLGWVEQDHHAATCPECLGRPPKGEP